MGEPSSDFPEEDAYRIWSALVDFTPARGVPGPGSAGAKAGVYEVASESELSANTLVLSMGGEHLRGLKSSVSLMFTCEF